MWNWPFLCQIFSEIGYFLCENTILIRYFWTKTTFSPQEGPFNGNVAILPSQIYFNWLKSLYFDVWVFILNTCLDDQPYWYNDDPLQMILFCSIERKIKTKMYFGSPEVFLTIFDGFIHYKFVSWHVRNSYSPLEILEFFAHFENSGIFRARNWISRLTWFSWFHDFSHFWVKDLI